MLKRSIKIKLLVLTAILGVVPSYAARIQNANFETTQVDEGQSKPDCVCICQSSNFGQLNNAPNKSDSAAKLFKLDKPNKDLDQDGDIDCKDINGQASSGYTTNGTASLACELAGCMDN